MPRLRQIVRDDAHPLGQAIYSMLFGDEQVAAIPAWSVADCWSPVGRTVLSDDVDGG